MTRALHSKDELFHVALYDWMRSVDLSDVLVEVSLHGKCTIPIPSSIPYPVSD